MEWYYAAGADRKGPVDDDEFQRLAQQGVITPATLVWREGMAGWEPHGGSTPPPLAGSAGDGSAVCAACGRRVPGREIFTIAELQYCAACKPQVLQRITEGKPLGNHAAEATRNAYISHEASVKSVGVLYYLGGVALFLVGIGALIPGFAGKGEAAAFIASPILLALGTGQFCVGRGLRRLRPWARISSGILSGIGLLGFPIGTIINGYILYLVCSQKGAVVFSSEYQAVIQQTPHIKYRTSIVVWIVLGFVLLLVAIGIIMAISSGH